MLSPPPERSGKSQGGRLMSESVNVRYMVSDVQAAVD